MTTTINRVLMLIGKEVVASESAPVPLTGVSPSSWACVRKAVQALLRMTLPFVLGSFVLRNSISAVCAWAGKGAASMAANDRSRKANKCDRLDAALHSNRSKGALTNRQNRRETKNGCMGHLLYGD
ncbi:MAG: hypothetical protein LBE78_10165 [Burkholderiaceae bacterium]|nr:hypothetical protein [Burkholderiaceae bacterium]